MLHHPPRRDALSRVHCQLSLPPSGGLLDSSFHRIGHPVGIQDCHPVDVAGCTTNGLDQRAIRSEKPFLVSIENRHQRHFRQIEPLAQQVDAHQHMKGAQSQIAQYLDALDGVDLGMQITHLDTVIGQVFAQLFRHALGQRGDEHTLVAPHPQVDLRHQVIDLIERRAHLEDRIDQSRGPNQLLDGLGRVCLFVLARGGGNEDRLLHETLELDHLQRPVVQGRGQAESVLDQIFLARSIALEHPPQLPDRDVALIDDHQRAWREVIDEGGRWFPGRTSRQMPRIILDAFAETHLLEHLEIEARALLDTLSLDEFALAVEVVDAPSQFHLDRVNRPQRGRAGGHVVARGVYREPPDTLQHAAGERIEHLHRGDHVVVQFQPYRRFKVFGGKDVDHVATHTEDPTPEVHVVALILHGHQPGDDITLRVALALAQVEDHAVIVGRIADAVDTGDSRHDHRVAPLHQRLRCRESHLLDVVVDARILLDEEITRRYVGFRLVVVVVGDEVLDRVIGEELAHLRIQLSSKRLVGREHERRPTHACNHVGHREGLARSGNPEERLERQPIFNAFDQRTDRAGLVACRLIGQVEAKRAPWIRRNLGFGAGRGTRHGAGPSMVGVQYNQAGAALVLSSGSFRPGFLRA